MIFKALVIGLLIAPAQAQVKDWTGAESADWFAPGNWNPAGVPIDNDAVEIDTESLNPTHLSGTAAGGPASASLGEIRIGVSNRGELVIRDGGRVSNFTSRIASEPGSEGMVTVQGDGSEWDSDERLWVGDFGDGVLLIEEGGTVYSRSSVVGSEADVTGEVVLAGTDSEWDTRGTLFLGSFGSGSLTVSNGARTRHTGARFATFPASAGSLLVTGDGSAWDVRGSAFIGYAGTATIRVEDGGLISNDGGYLGVEADGQGTAVITGEGSQWIIQELFAPEPDFRIGGDGSGTVSIAKGAEMSVEALLILAEGSAGEGTLNIGTGDAPGRLAAAELHGGAGDATLNFNHSDTGFHFTSDGTGNGTPVLVTGSTGVNHVGSGTTVLAADHTYGGLTRIDDGTLALSGSVSSGTQVNDGGRLTGDGTAAVVTVFDGGRLAPGSPVGTLKTATLSLRSDALLEMDLAEPGVVGGGVNDLIEADGNLVLDGTVEVAPRAGFGKGTYTLITYSLAMKDRGLDIAPNPRFDGWIDTSEPGRVDLVVDAVHALPTISLDEPGNGADDVPRTPLFRWEVTEDADSFELQVAPDSEFEPGDLAIDVDGIVTTEYQAGVELDEGATWFWRVRGSNDAGQGEWSDVWSFTTFAALPAIELTKQITGGDPYSSVGDTIDYSLTATNTGNVALGDVEISDPDAPPDNCDPAPPATLAPGETLTCQSGYTVTQADLDAGSFTNHAEAGGTDPDGNPVEASGSATAGAVQDPVLGVVKEADVEEFFSAGDVINYTITATNDGNISLTGTTVTDALIDTLDCAPKVPVDIEPGGLIVCTGSYTATDSDVDAGGIINTAIADSDPSDPVEATATVELNDDPGIGLTPGNLEFGEVAVNASEASRTLTVDNSGNGEALIDSFSEPAAPFSITGGSCLPAPTTVAPGESCTIVVAFAPTRIGDFEAGFDIVSNAPSSPDTVAVNGTGTWEPIPIPADNRWALFVLVVSLGLLGRLALTRTRKTDGTR